MTQWELTSQREKDSCKYLSITDSYRTGGYFFMRAKHILGDFEGIFEEPRLFWIVLSAAKGNFGVKKLENGNWKDIFSVPKQHCCWSAEKQQKLKQNT